MIPVAADKAELRVFFRQRLAHLSAEEKHTAALKVAQHFSQHELFKRNRSFGCYFPLARELSTLALIEQMWAAAKSCYLPCLSNHQTLIFRRYEKNGVLKPNCYQILEPEPSQKSIAPKQLDCVLLPLLAFDLAGHRLGAGAGYYDRSFEFILTHATTPRPQLIGLAYACQQAALIPADQWDVPLDGIITEEGVRIFSK